MKKNIKVVIAFVLGLAVASGVAVYASTVSSSIVTYTKSDNTNTTVEGALNELYNKALDSFGNIEYITGSTNGAYQSSNTINFTTPAGYKKLLVIMGCDDVIDDSWIISITNGSIEESRATRIYWESSGIHYEASYYAIISIPDITQPTNFVFHRYAPVQILGVK